MVNPGRGEIWWVDLGEPRGSGAGYRRPVLIVQDDHFNLSNLATVVVLSLTSNRAYEGVPGNIALPKEKSGLSKDSVINATQLAAIDKAWLDEFVTQLSPNLLREVDLSLNMVLVLT